MHASRLLNNVPHWGYTMIISRATASVACILLLIATLSSNAESVEINVGVDKSGQETMWRTGEIVPGDTE